MRDEEQVWERAELYRAYLAALVAERAAQGADAERDLLVIALIDKLEALLWVLGAAEDDAVPLPNGPRH